MDVKTPHVSATLADVVKPGVGAALLLDVTEIGAETARLSSDEKALCAAVDDLPVLSDPFACGSIDHEPADRKTTIAPEWCKIAVGDEARQNPLGVLDSVLHRERASAAIALVVAVCKRTTPRPTSSGEASPHASREPSSSSSSSSSSSISLIGGGSIGSPDVFQLVLACALQVIVDLAIATSTDSTVSGAESGEGPPGADQALLLVKLVSVTQAILGNMRPSRMHTAYCPSVCMQLSSAFARLESPTGKPAKPAKAAKGSSSATARATKGATKGSWGGRRFRGLTANSGQHWSKLLWWQCFERVWRAAWSGAGFVEDPAAAVGPKPLMLLVLGQTLRQVVGMPHGSEQMEQSKTATVLQRLLTSGDRLQTAVSAFFGMLGDPALPTRASLAACIQHCAAVHSASALSGKTAKPSKGRDVFHNWTAVLCPHAECSPAPPADAFDAFDVCDAAEKTDGLTHTNSGDSERKRVELVCALEATWQNSSRSRPPPLVAPSAPQTPPPSYVPSPNGMKAACDLASSIVVAELSGHLAELSQVRTAERSDARELVLADLKRVVTALAADVFGPLDATKRSCMPDKVSMLAEFRKQWHGPGDGTPALAAFAPLWLRKWNAVDRDLSQIVFQMVVAAFQFPNPGGGDSCDSGQNAEAVDGADSTASRLIEPSAFAALMCAYVQAMLRRGRGGSTFEERIVTWTDMLVHWMCNEFTSATPQRPFSAYHAFSKPRPRHRFLSGLEWSAPKLLAMLLSPAPAPNKPDNAPSQTTATEKSGGPSQTTATEKSGGPSQTTATEKSGGPDSKRSSEVGNLEWSAPKLLAMRPAAADSKSAGVEAEVTPMGLLSLREQLCVVEVLWSVYALPMLQELQEGSNRRTTQPFGRRSGPKSSAKTPSNVPGKRKAPETPPRPDKVAPDVPATDDPDDGRSVKRRRIAAVKRSASDRVASVSSGTGGTWMYGGPTAALRQLSELAESLNASTVDADEKRAWMLNLPMPALPHEDNSTAGGEEKDAADDDDTHVADATSVEAVTAETGTRVAEAKRVAARGVARSGREIWTSPCGHIRASDVLLIHLDDVKYNAIINTLKSYNRTHRLCYPASKLVQARNGNERSEDKLLWSEIWGFRSSTHNSDTKHAAEEIAHAFLGSSHVARLVLDWSARTLPLLLENAGDAIESGERSNWVAMLLGLAETAQKLLTMHPAPNVDRTSSANQANRPHRWPPELSKAPICDVLKPSSSARDADAESAEKHEQAIQCRALCIHAADPSDEVDTATPHGSTSNASVSTASAKSLILFLRKQRSCGFRLNVAQSYHLRKSVWSALWPIINDHLANAKRQTPSFACTS